MYNDSDKIFDLIKFQCVISFLFPLIYLCEIKIHTHTENPQRESLNRKSEKSAKEKGQSKSVTMKINKDDDNSFHLSDSEVCER